MLAMKIYYEGLNYFGSQIQTKENTIEGTLLSVLKDQEVSKLNLASRTDRYVSALEQIATVNVDSVNINKINYSLPDDVWIYATVTVENDFRPRYALKKTYGYFFPFNFTNINLINNVCSVLKGTHDFSIICPPNERNPIITLYDVNVVFDPFPILYITGSHFLYKMVRKIANIFSLIDKNKLSLNDLQYSLENKKTLSIGALPAEHLWLLSIDYGSKPLNWKNDENALNEIKKRFNRSINSLNSKLNTFKTLNNQFINK